MSSPENPDHSLASQAYSSLLPPRFEVSDPTEIEGIELDTNKVLLPDGQGGMQQLDRRVVQVEHDGQKIPLVALTDRQKIQRRLIIHSTGVGLSIIILILAFWLLTR